MAGGLSGAENVLRVTGQKGQAVGQRGADKRPLVAEQAAVIVCVCVCVCMCAATGVGFASVCVSDAPAYKGLSVGVHARTVCGRPHTHRYGPVLTTVGCAGAPWFPEGPQGPRLPTPPSPILGE